MKSTLICPHCDSPIKIISHTDIAIRSTYYYPICPKCKWTVPDTYASEEQLLADFKNLKTDRKDNSK